MAEHYLHLIAGCIGFAFMCYSYALYETEEKKLQNRLDDAWLRLDDYSQKKIKGHATATQAIGVAVTTAIEKIFGNKIWSWQNALATSCLSCLSFNLLLVSWVLYFMDVEFSLNYFLIHNIAQFIYVFSFAILLLAPLSRNFRASRKLWSVAVVLGSLVVAYRYQADFYEQGKDYIETENNIYLRQEYLVSHAFILCFVQVVIMYFTPLFRSVFELLLLGRRTKANWQLLAVNLALVGYIVFTISYNLKKEITDTGFVLYSFIAHDILSLAICYLGLYGLVWFALAFIFALLACLLLLHSIFWNLLNRQVYAIGRYKLFNQHKAIFTTGLLLLGYGVHVPELLKQIIAAFIN